VNCVGFLPDESAMFSVSAHGEDGRVVLTPIDGGTGRTIPLPRAKLAGAHPSGSSLVIVDELNRLFVADISSGKIARTRFVGGRYAPSPLEEQMLQQAQAQMAAIDLDAVEQQVRQRQAAMLEAIDETGSIPGYDSVESFKQALVNQIEEQIRKMREGFARGGSLPGLDAPERGTEGVFRIRFDPSGEHLALATMNGVRVYPWPSVLNGDGDLARPALAVDVAGTAVEAGLTSPAGGYVYDLDYDPDRARFLFAGLDGRVRFLDTASGGSGILLDPPARPPIHRLALSRDRSALALIAAPGMFDRGRNRRASVIQFWDYGAIGSGVP
jgi:hypothetical protein